MNGLDDLNGLHSAGGYWETKSGIRERQRGFEDKPDPIPYEEMALPSGRRGHYANEIFGLWIKDNNVPLEWIDGWPYYNGVRVKKYKRYSDRFRVLPPLPEPDPQYIHCSPSPCLWERAQRDNLLPHKARYALTIFTLLKKTLSERKFKALVQYLMNETEFSADVKSAVRQASKILVLNPPPMNSEDEREMFVTATQIRSRFGNTLTNYWIRQAIEAGHFPEPIKYCKKQNGRRLWKLSDVERALAA
jgi:hypothetical protein